jgi:hypothetical protein
MNRSLIGIAASAAVRALKAATTALLLAGLAFAPPASGAGIPIGGGETQLALNGGLDHALRREGVVVKPIRPAKLKGSRLTLPVASGTFDPNAGSGTMAQSGGFRLVSARKAVSVRGLRLDASAKSLSAIVAGRRMRLALLRGAELEREGFNARLKAKRLPLTSSAAAALNRVLGLPKVLRAGRSLGSANGLGEPSAIQIASGQIAIGGPDTTFSKLGSLEVQMGIWGATQRWGTAQESYFLFAAQPTTIAPDASAGIVEGSENDGVTMEIFAPPPREMLLRQPRIDLASRELSATLSPLSQEAPVTQAIATLDYSAAKFQVRGRVGVVELTGITAVANQFIADQLNQRFATPGMFQAGETLARITVTLSAT